MGRIWTRLRRSTATEPTPLKVSVVIASFNSLPDVDKTVRSLDMQSLPADEFEVLFVDDGSTDGTFDYLVEVCESRPHFQVRRTANSGWPGRPRNLGTACARGEYVFYVDHDDEVFPQALERMYDYASTHHADVLLGKEVMYGDGRTPGWPTWRANQARAQVGHAVLHCMTPHKLYRRAFIDAVPLRFPEGPVRFEDQYFNHAAYAATERVAILADYPCYRWHIHGANNHRADVDLDVYMSSYFRSLEPVAALPDSRRRNEMFRRSYVRVVLARLASRPSPLRDRLMADAGLITAQIPSSVDELLEPVDRVRSVLFRRQDWTALERLRRFHERFTLRMHQTTATWRPGGLHVRTEGVLQLRDAVPYPVRRQGETWHLDLTDLRPAEPLSEAVTTIDASLARAFVDVSVYGRSSGVEWPIAGIAKVQIVGEHVGTIGFSVEAIIDPRTAAMGAPLEAGTWDVMVQFSALGHEVRRRIPAVGLTKQPAVVGGQRVVAMPIGPGNLALEIAADAAE